MLALITYHMTAILGDLTAPISAKHEDGLSVRVDKHPRRCAIISLPLGLLVVLMERGRLWLGDRHGLSTIYIDASVSLFLAIACH